MSLCRRRHTDSTSHQQRPFLNYKTLFMVRHPLATFLLDYCSAFYMGLTLKLVYNVLTDAMLGALRSTHVACLLHKLHWLSVLSQVQFKVLVIIFKILHGIVLSMFLECICPFHRTSMLQVPSFKFYHYMGLRGSMTFLQQPCPINTHLLSPFFLTFLKAVRSWVLVWGKVGAERHHREQLDFCFCMYCFLGFFF